MKNNKKKVEVRGTFEWILICIGLNVTHTNRYIYLGVLGCALEITIRRKEKSVNNAKAVN